MGALSRLTGDRRYESSPSKTVPHRKKYSQSPVKCFGVDLTPDNIAVAMVYFVQGVLGLARLAVNFYLKDDLHLDPAEYFTTKPYACDPSSLPKYQPSKEIYI